MDVPLNIGDRAEEARRLALRLIAARSGSAESYSSELFEVLKACVAEAKNETGDPARDLQNGLMRLLDALALYASSGVAGLADLLGSDDAEILFRLEQIVDEERSQLGLT